MLKYNNKTITLTFGDCGENHVGMQKIGKIQDKGYSKEEMINFYNLFNNNGYKVYLYNLNYVLDEKDKNENTDAYILIIKNFVDNSDKLFTELIDLNWDAKAKMRGAVVNKRARYNLCFSNMQQEPNYNDGKGRIINYNDLNNLCSFRNKLMEYIKDESLIIEGNYYFDTNKCGIGYHGDAERRKVVGVRVGETIPLCFYWYKNSERVSKKVTFNIENGDIYIMSDKTVGYDWKKRSILTLRHAAGCNDYIN